MDILQCRCMLGWPRSKKEDECLNAARNFRKTQESAEWCGVAGLPVEDVGLLN